MQGKKKKLYVGIIKNPVTDFGKVYPIQVTVGKTGRPVPLSLSEAIELREELLSKILATTQLLNNLLLKKGK